jgi:hypothetical protein
MTTSFTSGYQDFDGTLNALPCPLACDFVLYSTKINISLTEGRRGNGLGRHNSAGIGPPNPAPSEDVTHFTYSTLCNFQYKEDHCLTYN